MLLLLLVLMVLMLMCGVVDVVVRYLIVNNYDTIDDVVMIDNDDDVYVDVVDCDVFVVDVVDV